MKRNHILRLHWKLFFPFVGISWLIIGITIIYFVRHEEQRQKTNLENRLLNVNYTVIDAYEHGVDLQKTVDFIRLFTAKTTLDPLHVTVYNDNRNMVADNAEATILLYDDDGNINPELEKLWNSGGHAKVSNMSYDNRKCMINSMTSSDGRIHSFAALPYDDEVLTFLRIDPMIWVVVIILGVLSLLLAYLGSRTICRNVYALQDLAQAISTDSLPDNIDPGQFSKDELGEVSRNLLTLYRDKIRAEHEKMYHERQIGLNISHELNTPVGIVKGYLDTVLGDNGIPHTQKQKFLLRAQQNIDRLANLVGDMTTVMRLQENGAGIERREINFHDLAVMLAQDVKQGHIADNMTFICDIPYDCRVLGHESLLNNALLNLIYNAAQHSGGTEISLIWLRKENGMHVFSFADNGKGVKEEDLPRLFDLFYRVDNGRSRKNGGAGLGMPLIKRIIVALGGNITVENVPTGGLRFTFSLPTAK